MVKVNVINMLYGQMKKRLIVHASQDMLEFISLQMNA